MRREVISEAVNNISDKYKLEALELHDQAIVSDVTNMTSRKNTKRLVGIGIAASLSLALGITAVATDFFGIRQRDAESEETMEVVYHDMYDGEGYYSQTVTYDSVSKYIYFEGPSTCNRIEYMATYLPDGFTDTCFGDPTGWRTDEDFTQFYDANYNAYNINIYYTAQFGEDGFMFFEDEFTDTENTQIGECCALKMTGHIEGDIEIPDSMESEDDTHYYYENSYIIMQHPDGYIVFLTGEDMSELEKIAEGLEIRQTDEVIEYNPDDNHCFFMCNGVG